MRQYVTLVIAQWRRTRMEFAFSASVGFGIVLVGYLLRATINPRALADDMLGFVALTQGLWLLILIYASSCISTDDLWPEMPRYLTRLPVSARKLAAAHMSYGIATLLLLGFPIGLASYFLFGGGTYEVWEYFGTLALVPCLYVVIQSVSWWIGPAGTIIAIYVVPLTVSIALSPFDFDNVHPYWWIGGAVIAVVLLLLVSPVGIAQHRKGRFTNLGVPRIFQRSKRSFVPGVLETFASKSAALHWYEHRRQWRFFPRLLIVGFICNVPFTYLVIYELDQTRGWQPEYSLAYHATHIQGAAYLTLSLGVFVCAPFFLMRGWPPLFKKDRAFLFNRPATSVELSSARWESCMRVILFGSLPLIGVTIAASFFNVDETLWYGDPYGISTVAYFFDEHPLHLFLSLSMIVLASVLMLIWASFWFENMLGIALVVGVLFILLDTLFANSISSLTAVIYASRIAGPVMLVMLAFLLVDNVHKKLVSRNHLLLALGLAPITGIGFLFMTSIEYSENWEPRLMIFNLSSFTTLFPLVLIAVVAPILTVPAITHWTRHRR